MLKLSLRKRILALNILAELLASTIFTLLYLVFISRYLSPQFELTYLDLSLAVGFAFFAAIYIPFYTYRINILPFFSIINALRRKQWRILWHKIPAQIIGSFLGVLLFKMINGVTTKVNIEDIQKIVLVDPYVAAVFNTVLAGVLCYTFYIVRLFFKQNRLTATIILSIILAVLFLTVGNIWGISVINPFGLFFYDMLTNQTLFEIPFYQVFLIHIVAPLVGVFIAFYKMEDFLLPNSKN